jgi:hypothetical protein
VVEHRGAGEQQQQASGGTREGVLDVEEDDIRARVLRVSSLPARNGSAGGGLVGSIFRGRWCIMSTCLCLPQLRERLEQQFGDLGIHRLGGVATLNIQRLVYRPFDITCGAITSHLLFVLRHPATPPSTRLTYKLKWSAL